MVGRERVVERDPPPPQPSLLPRYREGDDEAFRLLFERHAQLLEARVRRRLGVRLRRKVSVADIVQEVRLVAYQRRRDFQDGGRNAFRNWLLGIADNKARKAVRRYGDAAKRSARREVSRGDRPDTGCFVGDQPSPSQGAIVAELSLIAREAAAALPADYREVLRLARAEGLRLAEIAERMGRSREAVKKLYARALSRFAELFEARSGRTDA